MKKIVIYPGRFQPMLPHHAQVYQNLQASFPDADVYVATSNKTEAKSPFNFEEKVEIISKMHGIPADKIILAPQPYLVDSFAHNFDKENSMIIIAVGEKDDDRFPMKNIDPKTGLDMTVRGEPKPKYYQKINTLKQHQALPMSERGYIYQAPNIEGLDGDVASASAFRKAFTSVDNVEDKKEIFTKYMGSFNNEIFGLFYKKLIGDKMSESLEALKYLAGIRESAPVEFGDEPDDEEDIKPGFKQDNMLNQLGKVADSEELSKDPDVMKKGKAINKLTSVTTDDGDTVEVTGAEAEALMKMFGMLSSARAGEEQSPREKFTRAIQTTKGLENMLDFARSKGMVEETVEDQPTLNFDDIRSDYGIEEGRRGRQALMPGGKVYVGRGEVAFHDDYGWMARGIDEDDFQYFDSEDEALDYVANYRVAKPNAMDDYDEAERRRRHFDAEPRVSAPRFKDDEVEEAIQDQVCPECDGSGCEACDDVGGDISEDVVEETANNAMQAALAELRKLAGI